jgi:hypothetical protein
MQITQLMPFLRALLCPLAVSGLLVAALPLSGATAQIEKVIRICEGKLCPFFRAPIKIPEGWQDDEAASRRNNVTMLIPKGTTFGSAEAIIYVAVRVNTDKESLSTLVAREQEGWKKRVPDATITRLPDVARGDDKGAFVQYRYEAPSLKSQGFERVATTTDTDKDGNDFMVAIVVTALNKQALDAAEPAFLSILQQY